MRPDQALGYQRPVEFLERHYIPVKFSARDRDLASTIQGGSVHLERSKGSAFIEVEITMQTRR